MSARYRTEETRMLRPRGYGGEGSRRVTANEEGDVWISTRDLIAGRKRPKAVEAVFHHCVAVGDFHQSPRKGAEIVRARRIDQVSYVAIL